MNMYLFRNSIEESDETIQNDELLAVMYFDIPNGFDSTDFVSFDIRGQ